jgi:AMP-binding enzyme
VERGVGTGERIEAEALTLTAAISHRAITECILRQADRAGCHVPALIDAADGTVTAWPRFAQTVRTAACGLARRGVAAGDTVGVLVQDAVSYAIAVHSIRAAGATALPIQPDADIAVRLKEGRVRTLITTAPLAGLATQAADRSWVRQVFSFGEAEETTPFCSLLGAGTGVGAGTGTDAGEPTSAGELGPAGELRLGELGLAGGLARGDVVVVAPPCGEGQEYMSLLDLALLAGATVVAAPVPGIPAAVRLYRGNAAIVPGGTNVPGIRQDRLFGVE